jgi:hypothetical protein
VIDDLDTVPGTLATDDAADGPCAPRATFEDAPLVATPEIFHDAISQLSLGEARQRNLVTWAHATCRGPMLAVVSLLGSGDVEVRLLEPPEAPREGSPGRPAFALFELSRRHGDCGF